MTSEQLDMLIANGFHSFKIVVTLRRFGSWQYLHLSGLILRLF